MTTRRIIRLLPVVAAAVALTLAVPTMSLAHPLGNFTVNHYSRIEPTGDSVQIGYVLDMAEIPTFQEQARIDADRDGAVTDAEHEQYAGAKADEIRRNLRLTLDGTTVDLHLLRQSLSFPPGQGGLPTLRLEATFSARLPPSVGRPIALTYRDENDPGRLGWREIVARPGTGDTSIEQTSVPADDRSDELRVYPDDMLSTPPDVREARVTFVPGSSGATALERARGGVVQRSADVYAALAAAETLTPSVILVSLATALVLGALHALSPGHGKTVVAAYLVGSRGTARHALFLGATVTATHTAGVYALGLVTLFLSEYLLPERLYPILELLSGLLVVGIGGWLFARRLGSALANRDMGDALRRWLSRAVVHGGQPPPQHAPAPGPAVAHAGNTVAAQAAYRPTFGSRRHEPPPTADGHSHGHNHDRDRHGLVHSHGGSAHSHLPPGADGQPVTWRGLLALGVSGGLLPCPSALVVLLSAIALHCVAFGLLLIVAFSLGLAGVLVGIGLLLVYARGLLQRFSIGGGLATRLLPVVSAFLIMIAGLAITIQAVPQLR